MIKFFFDYILHLLLPRNFEKLPPTTGTKRLKETMVTLDSVYNVIKSSYSIRKAVARFGVYVTHLSYTVDKLIYINYKIEIPRADLLIVLHPKNNKTYEI